MAHRKEHRYVLPKLPLKAKVKSDHLGFREPSNSAAKKRIEQLDKKIEALEKEEQVLRDAQAEQKVKCRKDIESIDQSHSVPANYQSDRLYKKINGLFRETRAALSAVIDSENDLEISRKKQAENLAKIQKDMSTGKDELEMYKKTQAYLRRKLKAIEEELKAVQETKETLKNHPEEAIRDELQALEEEMHEHEHEHEEQANGEKEREKDDLEEATERSAENRSETAGSEARGRMDLLEPGQASRNREESSSQKRARLKNKSDKDSRRKQDAVKMIVQGRLKECREQEEELMDSMNDVQGDIRNSEAGEKEVEETLSKLDESQKNLQAQEQQRVEGIRDEEEDYKARNSDINESEEKQIEEWNQQEERVQRIYSMQNDVQHSMIRNSYSRKPQTHKPRWGSGEQGVDRQEEKRFYSLIEKILDHAMTLETMVTDFRQLEEKIHRVRDFCVELEKERNLEARWIALAKKKASARSGAEEEEEASRGKGHASARDHLLGNTLSGHNIYRPLQPGQVRLVLLMPAPEGCEYYPLVCALDTRRWESKSRRERAEYAALSYYWGTDSSYGRLFLLREDQDTTWDEDHWGTTTKRAICVPIRENLFRALLRLRRSDHPVALWVDYLSINQSDAQEKTEQLANMVDVYHRARNVCVWLGESDAGGRSDKAMDFIPNIMDFAVLDRYAKDKQQAGMWYALAELMRDRWFSRRWVVQEISLARAATVHCGGKTVQWSDFADAVSLLASNQDTVKDLFDFSEWREGPNTLGDVHSFGAHILLEATSKLFLRTASGGIRTPMTTVESLVTSLKTFDASDRRDLVYSIVSIASDTSQNASIYTVKRQPSVPRRPLPVDYSRSEIEVFQDFTRFCIESSRSLDIICRPWAMPARDKKMVPVAMPSWIPLLSDSEYGAPDDVYSGRENGESLVGPYGSPRYNSSKSTDCDVIFGPEAKVNGNQDQGQGQDQSSLFASGFKLAQIDAVSARNTGGVILQESLRMGSWTGIEDSNDSVPDQIWRTLVADRDPDGQIPPSWYQRACLRCLEVADTFNNGDLNVGELLQGHSEMLRKYLTRVRSITWNRSFFTASMGHVKRRNGVPEVLINHVIPGEEEPKEPTEGADAERDSSGVNGTLSMHETDEESVQSPDQAANGSADHSQTEANGTPNADEDGDDTASENDCDSHSNDEDEDEDAADSVTSTASKAHAAAEAARNDDDDDDALFGLGPPAMEAGDFLCILYGCTVPVVLRKSAAGEHYRLVGEVYVHGKMDGEAIEDLAENKTLGERERFEIR